MFGDKEFGNVGFPTPADIPIECGYRLAKLPSSAAWLGVFMGMLEAGLSEENWQQFEGGITQEQAAAVWADIISWMYDNAEEPILLDVRQNTINPCILEKTFDNVTWTPFANLQYCPPIIRRTAAGIIQPGQLNPDTSFTYFDVDDGPAATDLFDGYQPTVAMATNTNNRCVAAANAANLIRQLHYQVGQNLVSNTTQAATAFIEGGAAVLAIVFGAEIGPAFLATVVPALYAIQAIYNFVPFGESLYHDLTCDIYTYISGSAGNWTINWAGFSAAISALATAFPIPWLLIRELILFIGEDGINLALKTNQVGNYNCAAGQVAWIDQTLQINTSVSNNTTWQQFGQKNTEAQWFFTRARLTAGSVPGLGQGADVSGTVAPGYTSFSKPSTATYLGSSGNDIWWYNSTLFTATTAQAAIRTALGVPTYVPVFVGTLPNTGPGVRPELLWKTSSTGSGNITVVTDIYVGQTFAGC